MDQSRFDALTRRAGDAISRRAGILAVAGALFGLSAIDGGDAGATEKRQKRRKRERRRDRQDNPVGTRMPCSRDEPCPNGMNCLDFGGRGQCICADSGQPPCGTTCCPQGGVCCEGVCCGSDQTCLRNDDGPVCNCNSDGRAACNGSCCAADDICYRDRCLPPRQAGETCDSQSQCAAELTCCDYGTCQDPCIHSW